MDHNSKLQLVIKNARYYAEGAFSDGDILIGEGKILAIEDPGNSQYPAEKTIDAKGFCVLPGIIDSHVHFREPGRTDREDYYSGSMAAAAGGVTTYCDMPNCCPPPNCRELFAKRKAIAEEKSIVDFALYGAAGYENRFRLQEIIDAGAIAFKTFIQPVPAGREEEFAGLTVNDDGQLYMLLKEAAKTGGRYFFHCENFQLIHYMEKYLHDLGAKDNSFHYKSRPDVAETESVATVLNFAKATGAKVGISHITTKGACELVKRAKAEGIDVVAETCFHYLLFDETYIDRFGVYAKCNPPLRSAENVAALWSYLEDGTISFIGTDHAPLTRAEKESGLQEIWRAFSGIPSVEVFLPMMLDAVNKGRITLEKMIRVMSENTAKVFGFYPQKGCIAVGADADLVIVDLQKKYKLEISDMYSKAKENNLLFAGLEVCGKPEFTIVRGKTVMEHGKVDGDSKGYGKFISGSINKE